MRPWSRYIRASVLAYARVFVYLCGTPENFADEREREREKERGERKRTWEQEEEERTREAFSCEREGQGRREEPMASQGVLPFRYEGASRYVHLREHPTMQQEHQETNDSHPTITTATPPIVLLSF